MQRFLRRLALVPLFLLGVFVWQQAPASGTMPRSLLVVGDSLSAGYGISQEDSWVALLRKRLNDKGYVYNVVNASISGDTTTGGLRRLPRALATHRPALVVIELGGNDGLRATPLRTVRDNLSRMIGLARDAGAAVVLAGMQIPTNYGVDYTRGFAAIYPELAASHQVSLVEFFLDGVALDPSLLQADGIHPNAEAQAQLLENVWPTLEKELRRLERQDSPPARAGGPVTYPSRAVSR